MKSCLNYDSNRKKCDGYIHFSYMDAFFEL